MTSADQYRKLAAELRAKAASAADPKAAAEFEHLAQSYLRLAEQADKNSMVGKEPPPEGNGA